MLENLAKQSPRDLGGSGASPETDETGMQTLKNEKRKLEQEVLKLNEMNQELKSVLEEQKFQNWMYETKRDKDVEMLKEEVKDLDCQLKDAQADRKELLI